MRRLDDGEAGRWRERLAAHRLDRVDAPRPVAPPPVDFGAFWDETLAQARRRTSTPHS